jgi:GTP-binding protein
MQIKSAIFAKSSSTISECPAIDQPEIAFVGRSNVGKSSLINMLLGRKQLAKTSQTPGKTRLINHFLVNDSWHLVDLPGYGWAKISKSEKYLWGPMTEKYLLNRKQLSTVLVLVDSRLTPQSIDIEFINWLGTNNIPLAIIFTKVDKESMNSVQKNIDAFNEVMLQTWNDLPPFMLSSSKTQVGKPEVLKYINYALTKYKKREL